MESAGWSATFCGLERKGVVMKYADFIALPADEQIRLERIEIMVAEGISEAEAIAIVDNRQGELFGGN